MFFSRTFRRTSGILKHKEPLGAAFLNKVGSKQTGWNLGINSGRKHIPKKCIPLPVSYSPALTVAKTFGDRKTLTVEVKILSKSVSQNWLYF
ncbi:hypothetical protein [Leptospira borgpetersenii]|uniref:hypothetical protein n=1 Tax=Leptospira borgpetersenii TaxID=174 RepID=UPI00215326A2|nr:hypothetical protein [Leptospira borgpetersenii]UVA65392.1 hypothetical protein LH336_07155 [Leptospira borgpetersenii]